MILEYNNQNLSQLHTPAKNRDMIVLDAYPALYRSTDKLFIMSSGMGSRLVCD